MLFSLAPSEIRTKVWNNGRTNTIFNSWKDKKVNIVPEWRKRKNVNQIKNVEEDQLISLPKNEEGKRINPPVGGETVASISVKRKIV